jgi:hypothetical protein
MVGEGSFGFIFKINIENNKNINKCNKTRKDSR